MRLIDADALLKYLNDNHYASILEMCMKPIIDNQSTAYDVEKVVEQLKKEKSGLTDWAEDKAFEIGIDKAIEIVRNGGKE